MPAIAFPDAMAMLSTPPRFDISLPTEPLRAPSATMTDGQIQTVALTTPATAPLLPRAISGKKSDVFDSVALPFKRLAALKRFVPVMKELSGGLPLRCNATGCSADKKDPATAV
ncbi:MAG: hypothetical protein ACK4QP_17765, partial [Pseudorhizobium sp.]